MKYENKRNGQLFELTSEVDPKYNTVYLRNVETGKEQTITTSTLKRWYKKVEDEEVVHLVLGKDDAMIDCTQEPAEIDADRAFAIEPNNPTDEPETAAVCGENAANTLGMEVDAPDAEHYRTGAEAYLTALGYEWKRDRQGRTIVRQGGKTCAELYFGRRALKINVRKDRAEEVEALVGPNAAYYFKVINNYYLPVTLGNIPYTNTAVMVDVFGA